MVELENSSPTVSTASREVSGYEQTTPLPAAPPLKKKRNLPGMPDPEAEVIALSPKALLATNRFVCEICNKGFQRDQNLQLHRRGHNLPWKLKQRTSKEVRKRVYVCPEPSCVHHSPGRALGDLTGIKKHFCRKHGEKKWKCERCSKKYAVQSDWKAHMKTCGTREYKCDCGTIFSRRDSFITHRAFCDALAEESARTQPLEIPSSGPNTNAGHVVASSPPPPPPPTPTTTVASPALSIQSSELSENPIGVSPATATATAAYLNATASTTARSSSSSGAGVIASIFAPPTVTTITQQPSSFSNVICAFSRSDCPSTANPIEPASLSLSTSLYLSNNGSSSIFATPNQDYRHYASSPQPAMSATALLQKAAQMGAAASNASLLRGFGLATSSSSGQDGSAAGWNGHVIKTECSSPSMTDGLGLRLPSGGGSSALTDHVMMGGGGGGGGGGSSSSPFGSQPMTRDLLGLGRDGGGTSTGGLSALLTSFGSGFDVAVTAAAASLHNTQNNDS